MESKTVLFVDDEETILTSLEMAVEDEPYQRLYARSGAEALELLSKNKVHVIVTDMRMQDMTRTMAIDRPRTIARPSGVATVCGCRSPVVLMSIPCSLPPE